MPTNDERREMAAKLRGLAVVALRGSDDVVGFIEALDEELFDFGPNLMGDIALRLADLIEPEERTCERGIEMFSHAYPNEIVCDSDCVSTYVFPLTCGHEVELLENEWPSYCPHCGARVVADA